ncbi:dethiobiotin synthase [Phycisphaera mikurensis]|uniref:ATP-dependent dethiobiotin synthetase BioD n=1 Tax=Phycisphaera mikurensis (strain NBRC 102666 / KCTC 22515 / FYK2301M01) TaxID=1142394 RepID=I0IGB3_PHYMF|nr:dethiobiotin synthase [Phycisphaera mikurensis]MBB6440319.1 dethiobiotin synthetase [Phycisphaera mikurensis]BAM04301.1 dethiobiotin synthetase [Phycisphaera mikurensis NBRC 102666]
MFSWPAQPARNGLFVTATDTGVGKTEVVCGIAEAFRRRSPGAGQRRTRIGLCKPFATGCRRCRTGWAGEDIDRLMAAGDLDPGDPAERKRLCPQAFELPASPAAAAEHERRTIDFDAIGEALSSLDAASDLLLVEGIGGPKVPLDPRQPRYTVAEFAADVGYPVVVVTRAGLGTLSHTAMSVEVLQAAGCRVVGLVVNDADGVAAGDPTAPSNPTWLERTTGIKVLAKLPRHREADAAMPPSFLGPLAAVPWAELAGPGTRISEPAVW